MVFLSWTRPSPQLQKSCIDKCEGFNYEPKFQGATSEPLSSTKKQQLSEAGFFLNHARFLLGSGTSTFVSAKSALQSWRHFPLDWTFVDPSTPVKPRAKFCICVKELLPWLILPLQISFVVDNKANFAFSSGTLRGHLLAGEERFSVELDENNQVWYEVLSFSKPVHFLSYMAYPYVQLRQKYFAQESMQSISKHITIILLNWHAFSGWLLSLRP